MKMKNKKWFLCSQKDPKSKNRTGELNENISNYTAENLFSLSHFNQKKNCNCLIH